MRAAGDKMQFQFREVAEDAEKQKGDWSMSLDPTTGKLNGKIVVRLGAAQDVIQLERMLHSTTIQIGKEKAIVWVHNKFVDRLPSSWQGNASGTSQAARGRPPAGQ